MADQVILESDLPSVSGATPTREGLLAEARALGTTFAEVAAAPEDIALDAEEMLEGEEDLPAFEAAGFPVTAGHFMRIRLLKGELAPLTASRERDGELRKRYTAQAAGRRDALLRLQRRLKRRARAARLPAGLFSLGRVNTQRLGPVLWRVEEIALHAKDQLARFAQRDLVAQVIDEGLALIATIKTERRKLGLMSEVSVGETRLQQQLERLLVDTMRFVGAQGLALFDEDSKKESRYRLDHVYGRRKPAKPSDDEVDEELPPPAPETPETPEG